MQTTINKPPIQLSLFSEQRLAKRPYCKSDKSSAMLIRDAARALDFPYIQTNSPFLVYRIVIDVDRDVSLTAHQGSWHDDYVMPDPNWCAINPANGHAHISYEIEIPVARHDAARQKPIKLLAAIEDALTKLMPGADAQYAGLICKNPTHEQWNTFSPRTEPYDLPELSSWVDLTSYGGKRPKFVADGSLGRNDAVFNKLRNWAYKEVRTYKDSSTKDAWFNEVLSKAESINYFPDKPPLPLSEIKAIAKSVAKYCWSTFDIAASDKRFSEMQAHRGTLGGFASGATRFNASVEKRLQAIELRKREATDGEIAEILGVSARTVRRWLNTNELPFASLDTKP